jgi:hypothetical protein
MMEKEMMARYNHTPTNVGLIIILVINNILAVVSAMYLSKF